MELLPGKDGVVRTVKLQVEGGEIVRPVQRLYPLEVGATDEAQENQEVEDMKGGVVTRFGRVVKPPIKMKF